MLPTKVLTGNVVDMLLCVLHAGDIIFKGHHLIPGGRCVVAQQLREFFPILGVLMDTKLLERSYTNIKDFKLQ